MTAVQILFSCCSQTHDFSKLAVPALRTDACGLLSSSATRELQPRCRCASSTKALSPTALMHRLMFVEPSCQTFLPPSTNSIPVQMFLAGDIPVDKKPNRLIPFPQESYSTITFSSKSATTPAVPGPTIHMLLQAQPHPVTRHHQLPPVTVSCCCPVLQDPCSVLPRSFLTQLVPQNHPPP